MKTGLCSVSFRKLTVVEIIAAVKAAGLDGIEWGGDVHVPHGDVEKAKQVAKLMEEAGLETLSYGKGTDGKVRLQFRPANRFTNCFTAVYAGDTLVSRKKRQILMPGEMCEIEVDRAALTGAVKVQVEV